MPAIRLIVRGRVQGVGFRNYTRMIARKLGVLGEVWNRSDGGVEALAEHVDSVVLDEFAGLLKQGPGYVNEVRTEQTAERGFDTFEIGVTRA